ncbi:MAG: helix-turn-helix domain-containing protein [bacterium]|nr:helix-turn-helix domain-containing protein [bacterium]
MIWMFFLSFHQLLFFLTFNETLYQFPHLLGIQFSFPVFHGVLLFLYANEITGLKTRSFKQLWPHFIAPIVINSLAIPFFILSGNEKVYIFKNDGIGFEWFMIIQLSIILISGGTYTFLTLRRIRKSRNQIENLFSDTYHKQLRWLEYVAYGMIGIWILVFLFDDWVIFSGVVLLVLFIGLFGINQTPAFIPGIALIKEEHIQQPTEQNRYSKSGLTNIKSQEIKDQLNSIMEEKRLYRQSDLTLDQLAKKLAIHPNYLSQVINELEGKNFYHYINDLRVNAFIEEVGKDHNQNYTLLAIAFECGFNSKSTFNKYFKKVTGQTPSQYFKS